MSYLDRMIVDGRNREEWMQARRGRVGGSTAGKFAKVASVPIYIRGMFDDGWTGNAYTNHGNDRERAILRAFGVEQNLALFHAEGNPLHSATPDGIRVSAEGEVVTVQVKTSSSPISKISPAYARQMQWEMYVMGASRSLFVWEEHSGFSPLRMEPESMILERDDFAIEQLVTIADLVLDGVAELKEMEARNAK